VVILLPLPFAAIGQSEILNTSALYKSSFTIYMVEKSNGIITKKAEEFVHDKRTKKQK
jgi:hypothetical protein